MQPRTNERRCRRIRKFSIICAWNKGREWRGTFRIDVFQEKTCFRRKTGSGTAKLQQAQISWFSLRTMTYALANILLRRNSCWVVTRRELEFLRSFEPPSPVIAPSSGDGRGRGDGDVRPLREPYPTRAAEGAAWDGAAEAIPKPRGGLTACKEGLRRQESR